MNYRADIDGLRGLAVLSVILYHFSIGGIRGGFVGVDVFFVISGFLITGIIIREIQENRFSFVEFYGRRIRRILPALFVMLATSAIIAWVILMPTDLIEFSKTLIASVAGLSNLRFSRLGSGYFDRSTESDPLLHTWSLGVEEQFYLIFPFLLLLMVRFIPKYTGFGIFFLFVTSLLASILFLKLTYNSVFYYPTFRGWELLTGASINFIPPELRRRLASIPGLSAIGLINILVAVFFYSMETRFPGLAALMPCIGAAAVILGGERRTFHTTGLLSTPILVFVGKSSYSLYLWHWPILVFAKHFVARDLYLGELLALFMLSLAIGFISWKFVEEPFRRRKLLSTNRRLFSVASLAAIALISAAAAGVITKGAPGRFDSFTNLLDHERTPVKPFRDCFERSATRIRKGELCTVGNDSPATSNIMIWGDSHSLALLPAFDELFKNENTKAVYAGTGTCPPLLDKEITSRINWRASWGCAEFNNAVRDYLSVHPEIDTIILIAAWNRYSNPYTDFVIADAKSHNETTFEIGLRETFEFLEGRSVFVMDQVPAPGIDVPYAMARKYLYGIKLKLTSLADHQRDKIYYNTALDNLRIRFQFRKLDLSSAFCPQVGACRIDNDGTPYYWDATHLTPAGAYAILPHLRTNLRLKE